MKIKTLAVVALCVAVSVFLLSRSCGVDKKYKQMKQDYEYYKSKVEKDAAESRDIIYELNNSIVIMTEAIGQLEVDISAKDKEISRLSGQLDDLQNSEPSKPELEKEPLVINLRLQVAKLTEMFNLSQTAVAIQREEIKLWQGKYDAQVKISNEWKGMYERENSLRLMGEELTKELEKQIRGVKLRGKLATAALVVAGGTIAYSLVK